MIYDEQLAIRPEEHPVLFTEPSVHNKEMRIKLTEIMFESYKIDALFIAKAAVLSAFSCGRSTCLVFDSGAANSYAVQVNDGYALQKSLTSFKLGGNFVSQELLKHLEYKGIDIKPGFMYDRVNKIDDKVAFLKDRESKNSFYNHWKMELVRDIKENIFGFFEEPTTLKEASNYNDPFYELPDGNTIELREERSAFLEIMFKQVSL